MIRRAFKRIGHDEGGVVIVIVACFIPVFVVIAAFVIEIADGMEHRRQLQLQADAGALAAAQEFLGCRTDAVTANTAIKTVAEDYATGKNKLFPGTDAAERLDFEVNPDPCADRFVKVTLTESDAPDFFSGDTDEYSADAKVEIQRLDELDDMLPIAIPAPDPKSAAAIFVDEANNGAVLGTAPLKAAPAEDGLSIWETENPVSVSIPSEHVGVRIALSPNSSTACGGSVVCYDAVEVTKGLAHIRGWTDADVVTQNAQKGLTSPAILRSVALEPASPACEDSRFLPSFSPATPACDTAKRKIAVAAVVNFGGNPANVQGKVTAVVNGGSPTQLAFDASSPWTARGVISVPSAEGPINIGIEWEATKGELPTNNPNKPDVCKTGNSNPCAWKDLDAQRHLRTAKARSGPIELVQVSEPNVTEHANSLEQGEHSLDVKIGIGGTLALSDPDDPPLSLRDQQGTSQTNVIRCNPPGNDLTTELTFGCNRTYAVNTGTPCIGTTPSVPIPWQCVQIGPGQPGNPISGALNLRILDDETPDTCPAPGARGHNNWDLDGDDKTDFKAGDPRIVHLFLTRFGAFDGQGTYLVPVTGFAAFYITGWDGQGSSANPCQGNGDDLVSDDGEILGRYIPDVKLPNDGGGGGLCDFESIRPCTPVLVE